MAGSGGVKGFVFDGDTMKFKVGEDILHFNGESDIKMSWDGRELKVVPAEEIHKIVTAGCEARTLAEPTVKGLTLSVIADDPHIKAHNDYMERLMTLKAQGSPDARPCPHCGGKVVLPADSLSCRSRCEDCKKNPLDPVEAEVKAVIERESWWERHSATISPVMLSVVVAVLVFGTFWLTRLPTP